MPSYTKKKHYKQRGSMRKKKTQRKIKKKIKKTGGFVKGGTLQYFITCLGKLVNG
jgi:hypothetical protein